MNFATTNIRLPKDVLKKLKHKAVEENKSVSQLIRDAIQKTLLSTEKKTNYKEDPFTKVIGITNSGPMDGSAKHDLYLYDKK